MQMTTLTTVHDPGAAELVADAVRELGIPVELRRVRGDRYFGALFDESYQVRVAPRHLAEAQELLRFLEREAELALSDQTGAFSAGACPAEEAGEDDPPEERRAQPEAPRRGVAVRVAAPALLSILGAIVLGSLYRHGCAFSAPPGSRSPRAAARTHDSIEASDDEPRLVEDVRDSVTWGATCLPQILCLPSRR